MLAVTNVTSPAYHQRPKGFDAGVLLMSGLNCVSLIAVLGCAKSVNFERVTVFEYN